MKRAFLSVVIALTAGFLWRFGPRWFFVAFMVYIWLIVSKNRMDDIE